MPCFIRWIYQTYLLVFLLYWPINVAIEKKSGYVIMKNDGIITTFRRFGHVSRRQSLFLNNGNIVKVFPADMAILPCTIQSVGQREVVWRRIKDDEVLTIGKLVWSKDHRILVEYSQKDNDVTSWDLIIRHVRYEDAGMYECQLTSAEKITWHVELKVLDPVTTRPKARVHKQATLYPSVTSKLHMAGRDADKELRVIAGSKFCLHCNLSFTNQSATSSTLDWYKDGEMLQYNNRILLTRYQLATDLMSVSEVHIDNSHLIDSGSYHCRWKSKDIYVYQVNVLPDTNITGSNEDHFEFFAVDKIGAAAAAASTTRLSEFLFHFSLFFVISQFVQTFSSFLQSTEQGHSSDPT